MENKYICLFCGKEYSSSRSLSQHKWQCRNNPDVIVKFQKNQHEKEYHLSSKDLCCRYCHRNHSFNLATFTSSNSLIRHESSCRYNPKNILLHPDYISDLEDELDDDHKLFSKWSQKKSNAKTMGNDCLLTFDDYCHLVKEAGLVSSQLGINGEGYDLARYEDKGPYAIGNCRFITHAENNSEKPMYVHARELRKQREAAKKLRRVQKYLNNSSQPKDPRYTGIHNSSYGSHWITNGTENKKWRPWKDGDIPDGWRLGRVT